MTKPGAYDAERARRNLVAERNALRVEVERLREELAAEHALVQQSCGCVSCGLPEH